jgi:DNA polymerase
MMPAMVRLEKAGYRGLLSVHDEALTENANGCVNEFVKIMTKTPAWAKGLPIEAKGWCGERYRK